MNKHIRDEDLGASLVILTDGKRIVLVREPTKPAPIYWKFPGGKIEPGETPVEAAVGETREETGIRVTPDELKELTRVQKSTHTQYIFGATISPKRLNGIADHGAEDNEEIAIFMLYQLETIDFFPPHRKIIESLNNK